MTASARLLIVTAIVLTTGLAARAARRPAPHEGPPLASVPYTFAAWHGQEAPPLDAETTRLLRADAYLNRTYTAGGAAPVGLYVAYYADQRPGVSLHSPLHCLPGTGWETLNVSTVGVPLEGNASGAVRQLVIRRHDERAVVLYWYAIHDRMIASEVQSKLWLIHDGLRFHRSDAALVRLVVPTGDGAVAPAAAQAFGFMRDLVPYLHRIWS
jgi:EpsI family protein